MKWDEYSEIVSGLILNGRISPHSVRPDIFISPYDSLIRFIQENSIHDREEMIEKVGLYPVQTAHEAAKSLNGLGNADWVSLLEKSSLVYDAGKKFKKAGERMMEGEDVNWPQLDGLKQRYQDNLSKDLVPLSKIERTKIPFIETGWKAFDKHTMGLPEVGLVILGGNPGSGKTSCAMKILGQFVKHHPEKQVILFSIEMILNEAAMRFDEVENLSEEEQSRVHLCELPISPEEVISMSSAIDNLGLIAVDFADLMVKGETNESAMSHIYRTLMVGAKILRVPIILLSQLSRYVKGIPRPHHLRYTGLAESLGWMILMTYNSTTDWHERDEKCPLPVKDKTAFLLVWKVRGGFRIHQDEAPGAIMLPFHGDKGWHPTKSAWYSLQNEV